MEIFGLGLLMLVFIVAFLILLVVGVTFDRLGKTNVKWWVFSFGLLILAVLQWPNWTFFGDAVVPAVMSGTTVVTAEMTRVVLWDSILSSAFWAPIGYYLLAGLVYSILEFFLDIRRSARFYAIEWKTHLGRGEDVQIKDADGHGVVEKEEGPFKSPKLKTRRRLNSEVYDAVKIDGAHSNLFNDAAKLTESFISHYRFKNRIVQIVGGSDKVSVEPRVNKAQLTSHITAWTLLWPAYAMSLILGDLLVEIFNFISDVLVKISGQFVKLSFANVFKF